MIKNKNKNKLFLGSPLEYDFTEANNKNKVNLGSPLEYEFSEVKKPYDRTPGDSGFNSVKNNHSMNATMLRLAYKQPNKVLTVGDKMYVAGSTTAGDWYDNITKIPNWNYNNMASKGLGKISENFAGGFAEGFTAEATGNPAFAQIAKQAVGKTANEKTQELTKDLGNSKKTRIYKKAKAELDKQNGKVKEIVGHSAGGTASLELQKEDPNLKTTTYGAPVLQMDTKQGNRYRKAGDVISMFDRGAKTIGGSSNPLEAHSYSGYPEGTVSRNTGDTLIK